MSAISESICDQKGFLTAKRFLRRPASEFFAVKSSSVHSASTSCRARRTVLVHFGSFPLVPFDTGTAGTKRSANSPSKYSVDSATRLRIAFSADEIEALPPGFNSMLGIGEC